MPELALVVVAFGVCTGRGPACAPQAVDRADGLLGLGLAPGEDDLACPEVDPVRRERPACDGGVDRVARLPGQLARDLGPAPGVLPLDLRKVTVEARRVGDVGLQPLDLGQGLAQLGAPGGQRGDALRSDLPVTADLLGVERAIGGQPPDGLRGTGRVRRQPRRWSVAVSAYAHCTRTSRRHVGSDLGRLVELALSATGAKLGVPTSAKRKARKAARGANG